MFKSVAFLLLCFCTFGCIVDPWTMHWSYSGDLIAHDENDQEILTKRIICDGIELRLRGIYSHTGHIGIELKMYSKDVDRSVLKKRVSKILITSKRFGLMHVYNSNFHRHSGDTLTYSAAMSFVSDTLINWRAPDEDEYRIDLSPICPNSDSTDMLVNTVIKVADKYGPFLDHIDWE